MNTERIVVLGSSGFIGSHVLARAQALECEVLGITSRDADLLRPEAIPLLASLLRHGDIVVHSAAIAPARNAAEAAANLDMTANLAKAVEGIELQQVVVVSSDAVYGNQSGVVTEETVCAPDSFHGVMSVGRELACADIQTDVLTIVRPAPVYGVGDTHNSYGPNRFVRQALSEGRISVFGAGEAGRDHVAIADVADIIVCSIKQTEGGVINVASGQMRSFAQLAEIVQSTSPSLVDVVSIGSESRPTFRIFDLSGLTRRFPDHVPTNPERGIQAMFHSMAAGQ